MKTKLQAENIYEKITNKHNKVWGKLNATVAPNFPPDSPIFPETFSQLIAFFALFASVFLFSYCFLSFC